MSYYESYHSPSPQELLYYSQLRESATTDIGRLALASVSVGIIDTPEQPSGKPDINQPEVEAYSDKVEQQEMDILFRRVMGEMTMKKLYLDEAAVYEGRAAQAA